MRRAPGLVSLVCLSVAHLESVLVVSQQAAAVVVAMRRAPGLVSLVCLSVAHLESVLVVSQRAAAVVVAMRRAPGLVSLVCLLLTLRVCWSSASEQRPWWWQCAAHRD
ncbi:hypothetical protein O0L34_g17773 [Tuta absoluta]|nr:hypothetical protein O0L34_g17773 [Tuta absoluta]